MGFGDFINKLAGGTLSPAQQATATPAQPLSAEDSATTATPPAQPADQVPPSDPVADTTTNTPAPQPVPDMQSATQEIQTPTPADQAPALTPAMTPTLSDSPVTGQSTPATTETVTPLVNPVITLQPATPEETIDVTAAISAAYNALYALSRVSTQTLLQTVTDTRKSYADAVTQLGKSKKKEALEALINLLQEHEEAELPEFSAFQEMPATDNTTPLQSTLAATVTAFSEFVTGMTEIVPQEAMSILTQVRDMLQGLKNQGKELTAAEKFEEVYKQIGGPLH